MMTNILLQPFHTPLNSIPFEQIKQEDYKPAFSASIEAAKKDIETILSEPKDPDFENTIAALDGAGQQLDLVSNIFFNLNSAETNDYMEKLAQEVSPLLAAYSNDITLNEKLFARVKYVYEHADRKQLTQEQNRLLDKTYKSFTRNGALLSDPDKTVLREIDEKLSGLTVRFSQNILQETNAWFLDLTDEADLEGLPPSIREMAAEEAQKRQLNGWVFTLQFPSLFPFLKYARNRELRKKMQLAAGRRAFQQNDYNNEENIRQIVALREKRARLLGYPSHAAFVLEERMAKKPEAVHAFLKDLLHRAKPYAQKELSELKALALADGITEIQSYDHAYYAEKLREQKFDYSEEALKPYFPLNAVLQAAFDAAGKLYGLTYTPRKDIQKYHPEVEVYEVRENGQYKGLFYADFFPRPGKRPGAWETSFRNEYKKDGKTFHPHVSIVCNFSRPTETKPSLLTFGEVTTLFHEFGHSLHAMLADTVYQTLSGTSVYWDFVELPSQFMENFCYDPAFLKTFARHYQTGEVLPDAQIKKIVDSANFMEGYQTVRQLSFGIMDLAYHTGELKEKEAVKTFENRVLEETQLYPVINETAVSPSFSHIFSGGYSAGYYSYKWSEVLDADAFAYFKQTGIFNPETAAKFKTLLSKGGTEDPMDLYIAFRGRKPTADALLERAGLKG